MQLIDRLLGLAWLTSMSLRPTAPRDAFNTEIHNTDIPVDEQGWAANTTNLNDSDPDLVEFEGKVLFVGTLTAPMTALLVALYGTKCPTHITLSLALYPA